MTQSITIQRTADGGETRKAQTATYPPHAAGLWFGGWLFTIGFCKLIWWKAILGLVLWPYFLGALLAR